MLIKRNLFIHLSIFILCTQMSVCMYIYVLHVYLLAEEFRRRVSDRLELELQKLVNLHMHSRNQTGYFAIAASALNHRATF